MATKAEKKAKRIVQRHWQRAVNETQFRRWDTFPDHPVSREEFLDIKRYNTLEGKKRNKLPGKKKD